VLKDEGLEKRREEEQQGRRGEILESERCTG
jgi:hypothetical protein